MNPREARKKLVDAGATQIIKVLVCGRTGTGKSFLMNALVGEELFRHDAITKRHDISDIPVAPYLDEASQSGYLLYNIPELVANERGTQRKSACIEEVVREFVDDFTIMLFVVCMAVGGRLLAEDMEACRLLKECVPELTDTCTAVIVNYFDVHLSKRDATAVELSKEIKDSFSANAVAFADFIPDGVTDKTSVEMLALKALINRLVRSLTPAIASSQENVSEPERQLPELDLPFVTTKLPLEQDSIGLVNITDWCRRHSLDVVRYRQSHEANCLVMDYAGISADCCELSLPDILAIAQSVANTLSYLHSKNVLHCDVCPSNIFLSQSNGGMLIKLGGFQSAVQCKRMFAMFPFSGSRAYAAPEAVFGRPCAKSDMWSWACTIVRLITGILPYQGANEGGRPYNEEQLGSRAPPQINDLLLRCFDSRFAARPSAQEALELLASDFFEK